MSQPPAHQGIIQCLPDSVTRQLAKLPAHGCIVAFTNVLPLFDNLDAKGAMLALMNYSTGIAGGWVAMLLAGCAHHGVISGAQHGVMAEFVGSSPGSALALEFLGGVASNAPCHSIAWQVTFFTNQNTGLPSTFRLTALHRVPTRSNPNRSEDGPRVALDGRWEILTGARSRPKAVVYRITAAKSQGSLSFVKVGDHLLHLLNPDGSLAIGNGGESYTLNRADAAEKPGDQSQVDDMPGISYKIAPLATGPTVFGVFEGRTPCQGISYQMKLTPHAGCIKSKWRVTLYQNPETSTPTTYKVEGSLYREGAREGTWSMTRGAATGAEEVVYQLNPTPAQPALLLLKGDDNVLFFLDQTHELHVGHAEFSYTLNRVAAK